MASAEDIRAAIQAVREASNGGADIADAANTLADTAESFLDDAPLCACGLNHWTCDYEPETDV
jgi:hypothetical protein